MRGFASDYAGRSFFSLLRCAARHARDSLWKIKNPSSAQVHTCDCLDFFNEKLFNVKLSNQHDNRRASLESRFQTHNLRFSSVLPRDRSLSWRISLRSNPEIRRIGWSDNFPVDVHVIFTRVRALFVRTIYWYSPPREIFLLGRKGK